MDDGFKINVDKRHKSSSSLAGCLENVRSEKKLDIRGSIPEVDDQFALAEARCDDLKEKIDLVKSLKRKKKFKKRSMTTIAEPISLNSGVDHFPLISVSTQPKKKVTPQASRLRRIEVPQNSNPIRGYLDPDLIEQHQMLDRVNAYDAHKSMRQPKKKASRENADSATLPRSRLRRSCAEGDTMRGQGVQINMRNMHQEVACGDDGLSDHTDEDVFICANEIRAEPKLNKRHVESRQQSKAGSGNRRRHVPKEHVLETASPQRWPESTQEPWRGSRSPTTRQRHGNYQYNNTGNNTNDMDCGRPVVELFNKNRPVSETCSRQANSNFTGEMKNQKAYSPPQYQEDIMNRVPSDEVIKKPKKKTNRRVKYQSRRYELPTVSSQMKQAGMRYYYGDSNHTNIPFVVSKSTAPSHNVGVNIQQVLNGLKMQQPLSGIPLTIAHHMGLRHIPTYGARNPAEQPVLNTSEINVIKLGQRTLKLPSYKCMSYNRLLSMYREGEGIVPRFLNAVSRPHYFYTSMYDLATNREDFDGATSKGRAGSQEAKQNLAEYANLYREYERIEKTLHDNYDPALELRKEELAKQLTAREDYIRKVVQEFRPSSDVEPILRASASTADEAYRHSTFKLNSDDPK